MHYFGGKAKIAKELSQYINSILKPGQTFVDLFCGSCNVVSKIDSNRIRIANDIHYELIEMWKAIQSNQDLPSIITEEQYKDIRYNDHPAWLKGFVGFGCSYSGKWWGGFARSNPKNRNYCLNAKNSTLRKVSGIKDVEFHNKQYYDVNIPEGSLVYCDIPYKNTTKYSTGHFDHDKFYTWAKENSHKYTILVSEYEDNIQDGWDVIWKMDSKQDIHSKIGKKHTVEILVKLNEK